MPHTIPVRGYTRRRNVPEKMRSLLGRLGISQDVTVDSHDRQFTSRRSISCPYCVDKFASRGEMEQHIKSEHGKEAFSVLKDFEKKLRRLRGR